MTCDPRLLRPFVLLADERHFGRAARRLNVTQPALSQQIARLEAQLGVRVLERGAGPEGRGDGGAQARLRRPDDALRRTVDRPRREAGPDRAAGHLPGPAAA